MNTAVLPGLLLPGMLAMQGQMPSLQAQWSGTPRLGVPSFKTPAAPGNVRNLYLVLLFTGLLHLHLQTLTGGARIHTSSSKYNNPRIINLHTITSLCISHNLPLPNELEHEHHHRHLTGPLHEHKPRSSNFITTLLWHKGRNEYYF
jgi:hypothetical protein